MSWGRGVYYYCEICHQEVDKVNGFSVTTRYKKKLVTQHYCKECLQKILLKNQERKQGDLNA